MLKSIYLVRLDKKGDKKMSKADILDKIEDIYEDSKLSDIEILNRLLKRKEEEETRNTLIIWIFAIVGVLVVACAAAFIIYKIFKPDYLEDFEDDFDDEFEDFDDEFFEKDDE